MVIGISVCIQYVEVG